MRRGWDCCDYRLLGMRRALVGRFGGGYAKRLLEVVEGRLQLVISICDHQHILLAIDNGDKRYFKGHSHPVVVHKLLRKIVDHALDPAPETFRAARCAWFDFAADFMSFAFCTWNSII